MTAFPWPVRLAAACRLVDQAGQVPPLSTAAADQLSAASADSDRFTRRLVDTVRAVDPDRTWHQRNVDRTRLRQEYLTAAVLTADRACWHLKHTGPQPAVINLATRRADCHACAGTYRKPLTAADECDLCGATGVVMFHPVALRADHVLVAGDLCDTCAGALLADDEARP